MNLRSARLKLLALHICRILLAATFIFSGFVKSVDPWGTAIKLGEYFAAFGVEWLYGWRFGFAIWLTGAELMLGLMLLFKVRLRLISIVAVLSMTFFTVLTFVLALWDPVEDCGCFGEAIKLTNWETFLKNLVLLPMSIAVMWTARKLPIMPTWSDGVKMLLIASVAFGVGIYSYRHLPLIDFLPYKIGTNIPEAMSVSGTGDVETVLIYKDKQTGREHEFDLSDTTWYDTTRWEYVDTRITALNESVHPTIRDFAIFNDEQVITDEVLSDPGVVYMICTSDIADIRPRCARKLESAVRQAYDRGYRVLCLTAESLDVAPEIVLGGEHVPCFNMDATTIKTMLRAKVGVVVLHGGVIVDKVNCRDMLDKDVLPEY